MGQVTNTNDHMAAAGERVLALVRTKFPEYHPIMAIAMMAHDESIEDPRLTLDCHKTILRYVMPELKSIEVKAEVKETRRVIVSMFDDTGETHENPPQVAFTEGDAALASGVNGTSSAAPVVLEAVAEELTG